MKSAKRVTRGHSVRNATKQSVGDFADETRDGSGPSFSRPRFQARRPPDSAGPDPAATAAKAALAQSTGHPGLGYERPVEVIRDRFGVPHIYAKNTASLFFAQGFVAQDRMWQLDNSAATAGPARRGPGQGLHKARYLRADAPVQGDWDAEYQKYHPQEADSIPSRR
jgi:hypothetical protein